MDVLDWNVECSRGLHDYEAELLYFHTIHRETPVLSVKTRSGAHNGRSCLSFDFLEYLKVQAAVTPELL